MRRYIGRALDNITRHGDTDVFPFPIENQVFFDQRKASVDLLEKLHKNFEATLAAYPAINQSLLAPVGYTGFRWATQIDPQWNAYLLALVLSIASDIESRRSPKTKRVVFSYRYAWSETNKTIFEPSSSWQQFQERSVELARAAKHVLICDISDFYPRIYHHRLENALRNATTNAEVCKRIMEILRQFSDGVSYGLPVGGPAARLLSELVLDRTDRLLETNNVTFCRFADDYHIFAQSPEEAYANLLLLSELLQQNEGLLLQKAKTRVMSSEECLANSEQASENTPESPEEESARKSLRLRLQFDPYSPTATEDYEKLRDELTQFDIVEMLTREMSKSRVHQALARRLIRAVQHLDNAVATAAVRSMMENLNVLYPVFSSVAMLVRDKMKDLDDSTRAAVFGTIRRLIKERSYMVMIPTNLAYAVRVLAHDTSEEATATLASVFSQADSAVIRRDVILAMARKNADFWISNQRKSFRSSTSWERVALVISSYILGDEGNHWRSGTKAQFSPMETLAARWAGEKKNSGGWEIPA